MSNPIILRGNNGVADLNAQIRQKQSEGYGEVSVLYVHNSTPFVLMFEKETTLDYPIEYELVEVTQANMTQITDLFAQYDELGFAIDKIESGGGVAYILFSRLVLPKE
jgi:hypothetical protein